MSTTTSPHTDTGPGGSRAVYTVKETARLLSLSLGSTYTLIRAGRIPAVKLGARWVVPAARFHEWLNSHTADPAGGDPW